MQVRIGEQIRKLRLSHQLTQEELATRADLTKGFISQVERDRTSISLESLALLLAALDTSLAEFFAEIEEEKTLVFGPEQRLRTSWGGCEKVDLLIPGATARNMDPILVSLAPDESFSCGEAHDGEELGYVLDGVLILTVGTREQEVRTGECFYYEAGEEHGVRPSEGKGARFLWIAAPPRM